MLQERPVIHCHGLGFSVGTARWAKGCNEFEARLLERPGHDSGLVTLGVETDIVPHEDEGNARHRQGALEAFHALTRCQPIHDQSRNRVRPGRPERDGISDDGGPPRERLQRFVLGRTPGEVREIG